ncbi:MAG TPA: hypothetical protein VMU13_00930 [Candidatus Paceibacterota bacterium]|nr:hypothetical protein [Candidatus Paceibacterota bacterium]
MWGQENIHDFVLRCKLVLEQGIGDWGLYILVLLLGLSAFGLGRLSAMESVQPPVSITMAPTLTSPQGMYPGGEYIASRTGSVYYFPWCIGGEDIPQDAQIWFKTVDAAKAAGYAPAKNCKGLQ